MIHLVCRSSFVAGLPVRSLLTQLRFVPRTSRHAAAGALIFPLNAQYVSALSLLGAGTGSYEVQLLGSTPAASIHRRLFWLTGAAAAALGSQVVVVHRAQFLDAFSQTFFDLLRERLAPEQIVLRYQQDAPTSIEAFDSVLDGLERALLLPAAALTPEQSSQIQGYARSCVESGNMWQVRSLCSHLLQGSGKSTAHHTLALSARFFGDTARARWHYEQAIRFGIDPYFKVRSLASLAVLRTKEDSPPFSLIAGLLAQGEALLDEKKETFSFDGHLLATVIVETARAFLLFKEGQLHKALLLTDASLARLSSVRMTCELSRYYSLQCLSNKAQICRALGDLNGVRAIMAELIRSDKHSVLWWIEYAKVLLELRQYTEAYLSMTQALAYHFDEAELHALFAIWHHKMGQFSQCASAYQRALQCDSHNPLYRRAYQRATVRVNRWAKKAAFL